VWSSALEWQDPATVTEHVRRIRLKIEPDDDSPHRIRTVRGVGYAFDP
jgi:DNA-binding response OmpR family regulator